MNRQIVVLILAVVVTVSNCYSQDLLSVNWQKVVCNSNYISHVYSVCNDNNGNTYTLGSFNNAANCLEENMSEDSGAYFLTKQNSNGEKLFAKNLGGTNNFNFGDIEICSNGDLILGLSFKSTFFLAGDSITNSLTSSSIILKLDQNFNLKWYKTFPAINNTYINQIVLDKDENMYVSILFLDSLSINGNVFYHNKGYGTAIAKLNSEGDILWTHHYYSDNTLVNNLLKIRNSCNSCPETLYISGNVNGDSIFIDGNLMVHHNSKFNNQFFISTINENGDILQTKFLDEGIRSIANIGFYKNKIFFAGAYVDTVNWNDTYFIPNDYSSIYIAELSEQADIIGFADIQSSSTFYVTGFDISHQYGYLISGCFDGAFSLQSSSVTLDGDFDRGSFIASINDSLKLNDIKYIRGGYYNLRHLSTFNNQITGAAVFRGTCNFENQSCFAWKDNISTFQTTDIEQLTAFNPHSFPNPEISVPFSVQVYPNPFNTRFQIIFSEPIKSMTLIMTNSIGQACKDIIISQINDTEIIIDATGLSSGLYFVHYLTDKNYEATSKLIKVN